MAEPGIALHGEDLLRLRGILRVRADQVVERCPGVEHHGPELTGTHTLHPARFVGDGDTDGIGEIVVEQTLEPKTTLVEGFGWHPTQKEPKERSAPKKTDAKFEEWKEKNK